MADSFQGTDHIELRPGDANIPVWFKIPPASASTANDGAIPYGSTIISATMSVLSSRNVSSTALITSVEASSQKISLIMSHSTTFEAGTYTLKSNITFSLAESTRNMTRPFKLKRLIIYDE